MTGSHPQGRDGLKMILRTIEVDLGRTELEQLRPS